MRFGNWGSPYIQLQVPGFLSAFRGLDFLTAASQVLTGGPLVFRTGGLDGDDLFVWKDGDWQQNVYHCITLSFLTFFFGNFLGCIWLHPLVATIYQNPMFCNHHLARVHESHEAYSSGRCWFIS